MHIPRPDQTSYFTTFVRDSNDAELRKRVLDSIVKAAVDGWRPGSDLVIVARQPTPEEWALMSANAELEPPSPSESRRESKEE